MAKHFQHISVGDTFYKTPTSKKQWVKHCRDMAICRETGEQKIYWIDWETPNVYRVNETKTETEGTKQMTDTLYQVKGTEDYGIYLTKDRSGNFVLEMKGGGGVKAFPEDQLEEVLPYTVSIQYLGNGSDSKSYAYLSKEGEFSVGDFLFGGRYGGFAKVTAVDTKSKHATKRFNGWKLQAEQIKGDN